MQSLKLTFCVYRPWVRSSEILSIEYPSGYPFPSGHSVTGTSTFGTLARQYKRYKPLAAYPWLFQRLEGSAKEPLRTAA